MSNDAALTFQDLPLRPGAIERLILEFFAGQTVKRDVIVKQVRKAYIERGGKTIEAKPEKVLASVKKVLREMLDKKLVERPERGIYRFVSGDAPAQFDSTDVKEVDNSKTLDLVDKEIQAPKVEPRIMGPARCKQCLYVYYLPTFKDADLKSGGKLFRCKIGKSGTNLKERLKSMRTAHPEALVQALVVRTKHASDLERLVHAVLKHRKKVKGEDVTKPTGGAEWFFTTPEQVLEIISFIDPDFLKHG